jgi:hypothetical protein
MVDKSLFADPCTGLARGMAKAREILKYSESDEERASALEDFKSLLEAILETRLFADECREPVEGSPAR